MADAVYERMSAVRRMQRHREAGRVLLSMGRLGEAAGDIARSARPGDDEAVAMLRDAVRTAEQAGAFQEALTVLGAPGRARAVFMTSNMLMSSPRRSGGCTSSRGAADC